MARFLNSFLICFNLLLQMTGFCLIKYSSIHSNHSIIGMLNFFTFLAISVVLIRAIVWQNILKKNALSKVYLFNAIVPFMLLIPSHYLFNEQITTYNISGALIILIGLLLLFKSALKK